MPPCFIGGSFGWGIAAVLDCCRQQLAGDVEQMWLVHTTGTAICIMLIFVRCDEQAHGLSAEETASSDNTTAA
jgi:hypothetical protein